MSLLVAPSRPAPVEAERLVATIGLALLVGYLVFLAGSFAQGSFLADPQGGPIPNDFINLWAAGRAVLSGAPAAPYDEGLHRAAQESAAGYAFAGEYRWHYPPPFLFVAAAAAILPIVSAQVAWLLVTGATYMAAVRAILGTHAGTRTAVLFACGFPGALWTITAGQNGFLIAALIGATLATLDRRPALAGILIGCLSIKPQYGVLFPLVLAVTARWRAAGTAAATVVVLALASLVSFGAAPWQALAASTARANQLVLADGGMGFGKLQSAFGLVRSLGGGSELAWAIHGTLASAGVIALCLLWRSRARHEIKAAALSLGVVLATPYLLVYDLVLLAIPAAYLVRLGLATGFRSAECVLLPAAGLLILGYIVVPAQLGLASALILALLIALRAAGELRQECS